MVNSEVSGYVMNSGGRIDDSHPAFPPLSAARGVLVYLKRLICKSDQGLPTNHIEKVVEMHT